MNYHHHGYCHWKTWFTIIFFWWKSQLMAEIRPSRTLTYGSGLGKIYHHCQPHSTACIRFPGTLDKTRQRTSKEPLSSMSLGFGPVVVQELLFLMELITIEFRHAGESWTSESQSSSLHFPSRDLEWSSMTTMLVQLLAQKCLPAQQWTLGEVLLACLSCPCLSL